jgi:glyoxylase-like metal-dependent hydrolase (beta-lactamase superfamily II)
MTAHFTATHPVIQVPSRRRLNPVFVPIITVVMPLQPAKQLQRVSPHLVHWAAYHDEWHVSFDSFALITSEGVVLIDPVKPDDHVLDRIRALGDMRGIYLTNANHDRDSAWFRSNWALTLLAHTDARTACDTAVDATFADDALVLPGVTAIALTGSAPGSVAFHVASDGGIVLVGDVLLHDPTKGLELLPDKYCVNPQQARASLSRLLDWEFQVAGFAHGAPIVANAKNQIASFLKNRIN